MADILQDFPVKADRQRVFQAVSSASGLDTWWTRRASGTPIEGTEYQLWFGPQHDWRACVTVCTPDRQFELEITKADSDWVGTRVGSRLESRGIDTWVQFYHKGWPAPNEHYRVSCHCWAMYLRILRRALERGETVPYENRLDA